MSKPDKQVPLARVMQDVERHVERLESEAIPLEEAMEAFETGVAMIRDMQARLSELEQKVLLISSSSPSQDGETATTDDA